MDVVMCLQQHGASLCSPPLLAAMHNGHIDVVSHLLSFDEFTAGLGVDPRVDGVAGLAQQNSTDVCGKGSTSGDSTDATYER